MTKRVLSVPIVRRHDRGGELTVKLCLGDVTFVPEAPQ